jgi:sugar-specific transcriptional regulator TrmB
MNNKLKQILQKTGLSEKETSIYLASLYLGKDTVNNIAKQSGVKRPTTYILLNELAKKGLVSTEQTRTTTYYSPANPKKILTTIVQTKNTFEDALPELLAVYKNRPQKPVVQIFEGKEGMRQVYLEITDFLKKGKEVVFYGSVNHFEKYNNVMELWIQETKNRKHKARELTYTETKYEKAYFKKQQKNNNPNHQIKSLSASLKRIANDNCIFGNKFVIFSTAKEEQFATVITSENIAQSYKAVFEIMWEGID